MSHPGRVFVLLAPLLAWGAAGATPRVEAPVPLAPRVESVTATGYRVLLPIPAPEVTFRDLFGERLAEITVAGGALDASAGPPPLPVLTLLLHVPWGVEPTVTASAQGERSLGSLLPEPLPHLVSDPARWPSVGPAELASFLEGPAYGRGFARPVELPLLSVVKTAAGEERVIQVTLRPVRWDARTRAATAVEQVTLNVSWARLAEATGGRRGGPEIDRAALSPAARRAALRSSVYTGPLRLEPTRPWVRLGVLRPGLYVLSAADLATAGIPVAGVDPASFRIFRTTPGDLPESVMVDTAPDSLRECAIAVTGEGDGVFDAGDRLYFYATGNTGFGYDLKRNGSTNYEESQYQDEEAVWLTWGAYPGLPPPRRMTTRDAANVSAAPVITTAPHRVHYEENRIRDFNSMAANTRWERWFWWSFSVDRSKPRGSKIPFPLVLPGAQAGGTGTVFVRMWGRGISVGQKADHYANVYWDRALVAADSANFSLPFDLKASGFTVNAADTVLIEVPLVVDPADPNRVDQSELAWFEVGYPRRLSAINDTLQFAADSTLGGPVAYVMDGITDTTAVWFLDRTDPENPIRYVNGAFSTGAAPFTLTVEDSLAPGPPKRYALLSTARAPRPATIARFAPATAAHTVTNLLDPGVGVDYLIVAHPSLLASAESLATYRATHLLGFAAPRVGIATTDRIAAQLGGGSQGPVPIRNLLAYARLHWTGPAPAYVCLFGDASLDPKNYLGFGDPDLVPTYSNYYEVFPALFQWVSDDFYGLLDGPGDQILDIAVGRLPAKNAAEASTISRVKVLAYEGATEFDSWRARALLCADDSKKRENDDPLGNDHVNQMERKDRLHLPYPIERSKVYLNDYAFADTSQQSKPAARDDFISRINQGNWLVDYIGHGSDQIIADEQVFRSSDIGRLTNATRPSLFGFFSCTVGQFDALGQGGLGELLLKTPAGGAAASIAATEVGFGFESTQLNDDIVDRLFPLRPRVDSTQTVGVALQGAKNAHVNTVARKYVLLGDPGLSLPMPRGRGVWEKAPLDSVLRGDLVVLRGHTIFPDSSRDTLSSGAARIQVQGKPFDRTQTGLGPNGTRQTVHYFVPGPILFRGDVPLSSGTFEARFVVPVDARVAGGTGQLRALLSAAGGRGVGLAVDSLRIGQGISSRTDVDPPVITLLHPAGADSTFRSGDRLTFVIQDSSGVDLTRLDNAHTIFVIVDDRGTPSEVTPGFAYDVGSYTRGTVGFTLPSLAEGLHTIEIHASDPVGNIAVRTFVIDVHPQALPGDPMQLTQVFNYPNPFEGTTYIHARLNQGGRIHVGIYTVAGRRVRDLASDGRAGENYLPWDGKDSQGENVAIGVYLFRVTAESPEGKRASVVGRALRKR